MINSTYSPQNINSFEKDKLEFFGQGVYGEIQESQTLSFDLVLDDDVLITGGFLNVKNGKFGDKASLQFVHPTFGVIKEPIKNYGMIEDQQRQFSIELEYPKVVPAGIIIRLSYVADATVGVRGVHINYFLHKIMV